MLIHAFFYYFQLATCNCNTFTLNCIYLCNIFISTIPFLFVFFFVFVFVETNKFLHLIFCFNFIFFWMQWCWKVQQLIKTCITAVNAHMHCSWLFPLILPGRHLNFYIQSLPLFSFVFDELIKKKKEKKLMKSKR